jgi:subfamily B ATP-binding cassette protein MsbA
MMQENIYGVSAIKAFAQEGEQFRKFENENYRNFNFSIKRLRLMELQQPLLIFMQWTFIFILIGIGGIQMINRQLDVKDFLAFITAMVLIAEPVYILSNITLIRKNSLVALQRVNEILEQIPSVKEPKNPVPLQNPAGEIEFKDLSFHYPNHTDTILKKVNLKIMPNSLLAIVGPSGAGKTTLINLIPRFYDATNGEILLDGQNIKNYQTADLRKQIGIVSQETILFSGSIRENIAFGKPEATQEEIEQAAKYAHVDEFVQLFPSKYATLIGERGVRLSGGQKQRISIARAILKNPKILILDEATSALDSESEKKIQEALWELMKDKTAIVVAHRLSTIKHMDRIIVIEKGKIKEQGTHSELLKLEGSYANLWQHQSGGFV